MQTDPNWSNFLYQESTGKVILLDFVPLFNQGATREFDRSFTDKYMRLLHAGSVGNEKDAIEWSVKLGFLTGYESQAMLNAHINSFMALIRPFATNNDNQLDHVYDFSKAADISSTVRSEIPTMLKERLTPPPEEAYSLHRKLSGCFLLCGKLKAQVPCARIFNEMHQAYVFSEPQDP
jgi:aarF domain-containing kinase